MVLATLLGVFGPRLEQVITDHSTPFLPSDAPMQRGLRTMDQAFGTGQARSFVFVVLEHSRGLTAADEVFYNQLTQRLHAAGSRAVEVQEYASHPQERQALRSADGQATYIPVGLRDELGTAQAIEDVHWLRTTVQATKPPPGLNTHVTGDAAMVADLNDALLASLAQSTLLAFAAIVLILLLIYRRVATVLIPLITIGVGVLCARGVVALAGTHGMPVSTYTDAFLMAVALGAGTDYSVFVISRYQEHLATGLTPTAAAGQAISRLRAVLTASAGTIIIASCAMVLAQLALFHATGPAIALAAGISALVGGTLTPALLALFGHRAAAPARQSAHGWWTRAGTVVARRPARTLAVGVLSLSALAAAFPTLRVSLDESAMQPASTDSNQGYTALNAHFPRNELLPDYLLLVADHDLRNPRDLAVLDQVTRTVARTPGVTAVRSVTQPLGTALPQASLAGQLGDIGNQLTHTGHDLAEQQPGLTRLSGGTDSLARGADALAGGSQQATQAVDLFLNGLHAEQQGLDTAAGHTMRAADGSSQLASGAHVLAAALTTAHDQTAQAISGLGQIDQALAGDTVCTADPICHQSRDALDVIYRAQHDQLLPGLQQAAHGAQTLADGNTTLGNGLRQLHDGLLQAHQGLGRLADGEQTFQSRLGQLAGGASQLADGTAQLAPHLDQLIAATGDLGHGLDQAGTHLHDAGESTGSAGTAGVFLPNRAIDDPRFALARDQYLSPDGHIARMLVLGNSPPLQPAGLQRLHQAVDTTSLAVRGTPLDNVRIMSTGAAAFGDDLSNAVNADSALVVPIVLLAVLLILVITLRALIAPLYLLASVVLSYAATMGITTLVWQDALHQPIEWSVPIMSFVLLVAVGADYNILLASRIREQGHTGRAEIARAVAATGAVITSAGLIFASSFVAFIPAPLIGLAENGFTIATGLLLDTFVVRTLLVPSAAALLGRWNWWPGHHT